MAFMQCHCHSDVLGVATTFWAISPQATHSQIGMSSAAGQGKHPTLYLLHGMSDDHTGWMRRTSIERYATEHGLAVIMPNVQRSFYADMVHGYRYWSFISDELIRLAESFFPLSRRREQRFVAGLSMGGYGAFKLALRRPELFAAAASLSGALDVASLTSDLNSEHLKRDMEFAFGDLDAIEGSENDLLHLAARLADSQGPRPKLYQWCGTEDFLYRGNLAFRERALGLGLDLTYEDAAGDHAWTHWDRQIRRVLEWLPPAV